MSSMSIPKEQQTAYQRWEMSSFAESAGHSSANYHHSKKKEAPQAGGKISEALEGVRKEAFNRGVQEGFAVGMAKAKEVTQVERQHMVALANQFSEALKLADEKVEESILELALELAKAMLKTKMSVDPMAILPVVRDAIHYLPHVERPARIIVHHEDAQILRKHLAEELSGVWQIQEDAQIERGGCLVETGENQIDATNATRWKRISEALAKSNDWLLP